MGSLARMLFNHFGLSVDFMSEGRMTFAYEDPERDRYVYVHWLPHDKRFWGYRKSDAQHEVGGGPIVLLCCWV